MVAAYIKKIVHSMSRVTAFSWEISNKVLVSQVSGLVENFNVGINVKLCIVLLLIELYLFIPLSVTFALLQGHSNIEQF